MGARHFWPKSAWHPRGKSAWHPKKMLEVKDLKIEFFDHSRPETAVRDVDFTLKEGEIIGLVGESGSGKSLTATAIAGLIRRGDVKVSGEILWESNGDTNADENRINLLKASRRTMRELQGNEIGFVFQDPMTAFSPVHKIGYQVEDALRVHGKNNHSGTETITGKGRRQKTEYSKEELKQRAIEALRDADLPDPERVYHSYPFELSGGMRQRAMIASAMISKPRLLIADEPTTALDVTVQAQIIKLLKRINKQDHTAILFISHDLGLVRQLCEKVIVLKDGDVVESGRSEEIFANPKAEYTKKLIAAEVLVKHEDDGKGEDSYLTDENEKNDPETNLPIVCEVKDYTYVYPKRRDLFSGKKGSGKSDKKNSSEKNIAGAELTDGEIGIYDINLTIRKGEILGLVGESGSGKSTIARNIAGLLSSKDGEIHAGRVGMVFQDSYSALNPKKRIKWLLREALRLRGVRDKEEQQRRITEIVHEVEMPEELLDRYPSELSGGQRQRVVIAMALLGEPDLLIADEPVSALDVAIQESIMALLKKISTERGMAILFISHDLRTVYFMCHNVIVLKDGRIVESATKREIFEHPKAEYTKELLRSALGEEEI